MELKDLADGTPNSGPYLGILGLDISLSLEQDRWS